MRESTLQYKHISSRYICAYGTVKYKFADVYQHTVHTVSISAFCVWVPVVQHNTNCQYIRTLCICTYGISTMQTVSTSACGVMYMIFSTVQNCSISACMVHVWKSTVQYKPVVYPHAWYMCGKLQYSTNRQYIRMHGKCGETFSTVQNCSISAFNLHVEKRTVQYKPVVYLHAWYMWENYSTVQTGCISA